MANFIFYDNGANVFEPPVPVADDGWVFMLIYFIDNPWVHAIENPRVPAIGHDYWPNDLPVLEAVEAVEEVEMAREAEECEALPSTRQHIHLPR